MTLNREKIAEALYVAFKVQDEYQYVGVYKFHDSIYTTLDGQWDLLKIVNKIIPVILDEYLAKEIDAFTPAEPTTTTIGSDMKHVTLTINLPDDLKIDLKIDLNKYITVDNIVTSALKLYPTATSMVIELS